MEVSCGHHDLVALSTVKITGLVGPRAGLDGFGEENSSTLLGFESRTVQPVA